MSKDKTYKNVTDDGYTTYHSDGSKTKTYKNTFDSGITSYHDDGSRSVTYKNIFDNGLTTYHYGKTSISRAAGPYEDWSIIGKITFWFVCGILTMFFGWCINQTIGNSMWFQLGIIIATIIALTILRRWIDAVMLAGFVHTVCCFAEKRIIAVILSTEVSKGDQSIEKAFAIVGVCFLALMTFGIVILFCDMDRYHIGISLFYFLSYVLVLIGLPFIQDAFKIRQPLDYYWLGIMLIFAILSTVIRVVKKKKR